MIGRGTADTILKVDTLRMIVAKFGSNWLKWFQRRRFLKKFTTTTTTTDDDGRTTDDGRRTPSDGKSSHCLLGKVS